MAAGATPLWTPNGFAGSFRAPKPGLRGQPRVLDITHVIHHDGASLSKISLPEATERLAPFVAVCDDANTSVFVVMSEATAVSTSAVRIASFRNAEGVRMLVMWALEALRTSLLYRGSKVYLPPLLVPAAPGQAPAAQPAGPGAEPAAPEASDLAAGTTGPEAQPAPAAEGGVPRSQRQQFRAEGVLEDEAATPSKGPGSVLAPAVPKASQTTAQRTAAGEAVQRGDN